MRLQFCTWPQVETYLTRQKGIVIPIGSTEQHGPMGLIGTDALCPEIIAHTACDIEDFMIGPTLSVGMAQHHLSFPGSITLRPTTLIAVIKDVVLSLVRTGFTHIYFLNGHGGNIASVNAAFSEIYSEYSLGFRQMSKAPFCRLANWFTLEGVQSKIRDLFGRGEGQHATPSEISITQFAYPAHVYTMAERPASPWERSFTDSHDYRSLHPDGRMMSDSFLASPKAGKELTDIAARALIQDFQTFMKASHKDGRSQK